MASVQFTWSDMWLQWYAEQVNDEVKNEFLEQVELKKLVTRVSPKVQLEILEFAPEDVKKLVANSLHPQVKKKILWNVEEEKVEDEYTYTSTYTPEQYREMAQKILNDEEVDWNEVRKFM